MDVTIIIEGEPGAYFCYPVESIPHCGIHGYGETIEECKEDLLVCIDEVNQMGAEEGWQLPEMNFTYRIDKETRSA